MSSMFRSSSGRFFILKFANMLLAILWGFGFTFVLIRVLSVEIFAFLTLINAIGSSLAIADMGISKVLLLGLSKQREITISPRASSGFALGILWMYLALSGLVTLIFVLGVDSLWDIPVDVLTGSALFLAGSLNMPWLLIKNIAMGVDKYLSIERIDLVRRTLFLVLLASILYGLPIQWFMFGLLIIWAVSYIWVIKFILSPQLNLSSGFFGQINEALAFMKAQGGLISNSISFNLAEFSIYQSPLFVIPAVFGLGWAAVAGDTFFKFYRAATTAFRAVSESQVPAQLEALRSNNYKKLKQVMFRSALLTTVLAISGTTIFAVLGSLILDILLGKSHEIPEGFIWVSIAFILANSIQNLSASLLLHAGQLSLLRKISFLMLILIISGFVVAVGYDIDILGLLSIYTIVYSIGSTIYAYFAYDFMVKFKLRDESLKQGRT